MQTFDRPAIKAEAKNLFYANRSLCVSMALVVVLANVVLTSVSAGFLSILLTGVISVTSAGFFLHIWRETPQSVSQAISDTFDVNFLRKMGGMLWMMLKTFLWSLLFMIPGIIKAYAYSMTQYVLYDCPNVPAMEASRISEKITRGHKWELFIASLSFLGWDLLGVMTLGILEVLFVLPYKETAYAGIYEELKQLALDTGAVTQAELNGQVMV